jgi:hypothetical protein
MRTGRVDVPGRLKVAKLRLPPSNPRTFFVAMQDGYESGILLPEQLHAVPEDEAHHLAVAIVASPISYVDSIRGDDSLLTALMGMERSRRDHVVVLDWRERIAGVVTRNEIASITNGQTVEAMSDVPSEYSRAKAA